MAILILSVRASHQCLESKYVTVTDTYTNIYLEQGINMYHTFTLPPDRTCKYDFDAQSKEMFYITKQDPEYHEGFYIGKYIEFSWDYYTFLNGECVFEYSGNSTEQYFGKFLDFPDLITGVDGSFCKVFFYFRAANCGNTCTDEDRTFYIFS